MTDTQPAPQLNPINMEHRVTVLEQAQLRTVEQIGNMAGSIERLSTTITQTEKMRLAEMETVHEAIDDIVTGIARRRDMDESHATGFTEGRQSVEIKLPLKQIAFVIVTVGGVVGVIAPFVTWAFSHY